jgi:hypothetical protein
MKQTKRRLIAAPLALSCLALLAGCDGDISTVKDQIYPGIDSSMRLGKALKTRTDCENGKWDSYSDKRGRDVVRYTCTLPQLYLDTFKGRALAQYHEPEKGNLDKRISELANRKNDTQQLRDYLLANYNTLVSLNAIDKTILQRASDFLFFDKGNPKDTLNADGLYPVPSRASTDRECQYANLSSCDVFYNTVTTLTGLFNGLMKALNYKASYSYFILPHPTSDISDIHPGSYAENSDLLGKFNSLINGLLDAYHPFLSSNEIGQDYSALIPRINTEINKEITDETNNYNKQLQSYNSMVSNATFSTIQEDFYWYIDDTGNPVDNGGTLTFTRNGKSTTVQMKDSDDYLAVAYQSFAPDRIPNIYLNAIGLFYYNSWLINSRGGI